MRPVIRFFLLCAWFYSAVPATAAAIAPSTAQKPLQQTAPSSVAMTGWCQQLSARIPSVSLVQCQQSVLQPSGVRSRKGFPILVRELAPQISAQLTGTNPTSPAKIRPVRVLMLGGIHGDELTASAIVFQWLQQMQTPAAQSIHWKIAPVVNPDGLLASKPMRVNANGVDLNRNFPTPQWHQEAPKYWAKVTGSDPRRFPGTAPLSEPESRWVNDTIERFKPDVIVSVHAPFGVLDFDGPATPPERFGRLIYNRVGVYPGSLGNYSGLHKQVPVITIELPNAQDMPSAAETQRIWQDMLSWIKRNVQARGASPQLAQTPQAVPISRRQVDPIKYIDNAL